MSERTKKILERWISVVACGVVAAAVWMLIEPFVTHQEGTVASEGNESIAAILSHIGHWQLLLLIGIIAGWVIIQQGTGRWQGLLEHISD